MRQWEPKVDELDRRILNLIQMDFPISSRPFLDLANRLGVSEDDVLERVKALKAAGVIRRIGGSFDSRKLGFFSTLCAARVGREKMDTFNRVINSYPGVTHNYTRNCRYNIWFTFIGETEKDVERALMDIARKTGVRDIINLPAIRIFKIRVNFEI